jgi:hypothetical protein
MRLLQMRSPIRSLFLEAELEFVFKLAERFVFDFASTCR